MKKVLIVFVIVAVCAAPVYAQPDLAIESLLSAIEDGTVVVGFLMPDCPNGWVLYDKAVDRFLIGAGGEHATLPGIEGGYEKHSHTGTVHSPEGNIYSGDEKPKASSEPHSHRLTIEPAELPPFVGVRFCIPKTP